MGTAQHGIRGAGAILTRRHHEAFKIIRDFQTLHGYPPSYRELARKLHSCPSHVKRLLDDLEQNGRIARQKHAARSIIVVDRPPLLASSLTALLSTLPTTTALKLSLHCEKTGEAPEAVIADALTLHFDDLERIEAMEATKCL